MRISIANPIYDSVFKYIMEDERIAKTILSALLKQNVESVELRPHEYPNETKEQISMFRIDFAARIREENGNSHLILIELQKTWVETETLRFRQYLGAQYANKLNMVKDKDKEYALPMVAIYIMGHRIGDIDVPVLYVSHKPYDYNGNEVTKGMPDPFVESLTHDSIIVQIPLLHGRINKRLDKVLSVFDQTYLNRDDPHQLIIDEDNYAGDPDMEYILHRLVVAAADNKMRMDMNVEDEYFSAIENRDTAIMNRDKKLKELDHTIAEQKGTIAEQKGTIAEQKGTIAEQKGILNSLIRDMLNRGLSIEDISKITGKDSDFISQIVNAE